MIRYARRWLNRLNPSPREETTPFLIQYSIAWYCVKQFVRTQHGFTIMRTQFFGLSLVSWWIEETWSSEQLHCELDVDCKEGGSAWEAQTSHSGWSGTTVSRSFTLIISEEDRLRRVIEFWPDVNVVDLEFASCSSKRQWMAWVYFKFWKKWYRVNCFIKWNWRIFKGITLVIRSNCFKNAIQFDKAYIKRVSKEYCWKYHTKYCVYNWQKAFERSKKTGHYQAQTYY